MGLSEELDRILASAGVADEGQPPVALPPVRTPPRPKPTGSLSAQLDALLPSAAGDSAPAPAAPRRGGVRAAVAQPVKDMVSAVKAIPGAVAQPFRDMANAARIDAPALVKGLPEAITQTYAKDVPGAIMSMGGGLVRAVPELLSGLPGVAGETASKTSEDIQAAVHRGHEAIGAQSGTPGVETLPDMAGQLLALGKPTAALSEGLSKLPLMRRLAAEGLREGIKDGKKILYINKAQLLENVIQGQIITGLYTVARKPQAGESAGDVLLSSAKLDMELTAGAALLPPLARSVLFVGGKLMPDVVRQQFRWLGLMPEPVRDIFRQFYLDRSDGEVLAKQWAKDAARLPEAERLVIGQRLRSALRMEDRHQVDEATRTGYLAIQAEMDAVRADRSLSQLVRQKQVQSLRQQQRRMLEFTGVPEQSMFGWLELQGQVDRLAADLTIPPEQRQAQIQALRDQQTKLWQNAQVPDSATLDNVLARGRAMRDKESGALQERIPKSKPPEAPADENPTGVYYKPLTRRQIRDLRRERQGVTEDLKKELQDFNQKSVRANGGNPQVERLLESLPEIVKLSKGEVAVLRNTKEALERELTIVRKSPFANREKIKGFVDRIQQINTSIHTSYQFGGTEYSPRYYFPKDQEEAQVALGVIQARGPRVDMSLRLQRDALAPGAQAADRATLGVEIEQLTEERDKFARAIQDFPLEASDVKMTDLVTRLNALNRDLRRKQGQLVLLTSREILDPTYPLADKLSKLVDDRTAHTLFAQLARQPAAVRIGGAPGKDWVQLTGKTLGNLDGAWFHKDVAGQVREVANIPSEAAGMYETLMRVWKINKTALNPATHFRNALTNSPFMDFGGVGPARQVKAYDEAIRSMLRDDMAAREFERVGFGKRGKFSEFELRQIAGLAERAKAAGSELKWYERIAQLQQELPGAQAAQRIYAAEDEVARFVLFRHARDLGLSVEEAARHVDRYMPNYTHIPRNTVTKMLGYHSPFFSFAYASTPIMVKNLAEQPLKFGKWLALGKTLNDVSAKMIGIPEDQQDAIRGVLPNYLQHNVFVAPSILPLMPALDRYGRPLYLDASYWIPMNNMLDEPEMSMKMLMPNNPVFRVIAEIGMNHQLYNDRPIWEHSDSKTIVAEKVAGYLYNQAVPSIAGWGINRIQHAITDNPDYPKQGILPAVADSVFGVKTRAFDPVQLRKARVAAINEAVRDARSQMRRVRRSTKLSAEEKRDELARLQEVVRETNATKRTLPSVEALTIRKPQ